MAIPANTIVKRFDAPEDYHTFLMCTNNYWRRDHDSHWGADWDACCDNLLKGDTRNLDAAMKLIDKMQDEHIFLEGLPTYAPAIVGSFANVPASIMGHPMDMFAKQSIELESDLSPITIYIETVVSGGVSVTELNARGVCCLAFALAMNNVRPVEIYALSPGRPYGGDTAIIATRIASSPMDISRAVFMLTDEAYARKMNFAAMCHLTDTDTGYIGWAWNGFPTDAAYQTKMRASLDMQPQDVYIPGGHLFDKLMCKDPVQWVKDMIAQHGGNKDE